MNVDNAEVVIDLSKCFIDFLENTYGSEWKNAYYRFYFTTTELGANASVALNSKIKLIGALDHNDFYNKARVISENLVSLYNKDNGVFILNVNKDYDYHIDFDFDNHKRWEISKLNKGKGLPLDLNRENK